MVSYKNSIRLQCCTPTHAINCKSSIFSSEISGGSFYDSTSELASSCSHVFVMLNERKGFAIRSKLIEKISSTVQDEREVRLCRQLVRYSPANFVF